MAYQKWSTWNIFPALLGSTRRVGPLDESVYNPRMLDEARAREILQPFGLTLSARQLAQILAYLELLLRWNRRINLTSLTRPEECLTRHFGESLFLARAVRLEGRLLDVGSGAGFPGLALKIACPELAVTLLEPVGKKRAFLKEAARACGFDAVEVRSERLQDYAPSVAGRFDAATVRALGQTADAVLNLTPCLKPGGLMCLWLGRSQVESLGSTRNLEWRAPIELPLSKSRVILIGTVRQGD
jgi:16S rRNA (guanine527-N7)-methyltransferase